MDRSYESGTGADTTDSLEYSNVGSSFGASGDSFCDPRARTGNSRTKSDHAFAPNEPPLVAEQSEDTSLSNRTVRTFSKTNPFLSPLHVYPPRQMPHTPSTPSNWNSHNNTDEFAEDPLDLSGIVHSFARGDMSQPNTARRDVVPNVASPRTTLRPTTLPPSLQPPKRKSPKSSRKSTVGGYTESMYITPPVSSTARASYWSPNTASREQLHSVVSSPRYSGVRVMWNQDYGGPTVFDAGGMHAPQAQQAPIEWLEPVSMDPPPRYDDVLRGQGVPETYESDSESDRSISESTDSHDGMPPTFVIPGQAANVAPPVGRPVYKYEKIYPRRWSAGFMAASVMLIIAGFNFLNLVLPTRPDLGTLNICFMTCFVSILPLSVIILPPVWKRCTRVHISEREKELRAEAGPRWQLLLLPWGLAVLALGSVISAYFAAALSVLNPNVYAIFSAPQSFVGVGLLMLWPSERPTIVTAGTAFIVVASHIFILWDPTQALHFPEGSWKLVLTTMITMVANAVFAVGFRRSIRFSGLRWTVFPIAIVTMAGTFGIAFLFQGFLGWSTLYDASLTSFNVIWPYMIQIIMFVGLFWSFIGLAHWSDGVVLVYASQIAITTSNPRIVPMLIAGTSSWFWTLIVGLAGVVAAITIICINAFDTPGRFAKKFKALNIIPLVEDRAPSVPKPKKVKSHEDIIAQQWTTSAPALQPQSSSYEMSVMHSTV